jgi:dihydrofolate reductase
MIISIIVAADENNGIGFQNKIPWHLPLDLRRFRKLTMGHHLIMGRRTYESIGAPLPGRNLIVLSRDPSYSLKDCFTAQSLELGYRLAIEAGEAEAFIAGGEEVFIEALPHADHLYLTRVHASVKADTHFPMINDKDWIEICQQYSPADEQNQFPQTFFHYIKNKHP